MKENWRMILGFEHYKISDLGKIRNIKTNKPLNGSLSKSGYLKVTLRHENKMYTKNIHSLVAINFLNHTPNGHILVVNHKDLNKLNNSSINLEIISNRENCNKRHLRSSSRFTGVCWSNLHKKWVSKILYNKKTIHLGYFESDYEASEYYKKALESIKNGHEILIKRSIKSSKYRGVSWCNSKNRWCVYIQNDKRVKYVGRYLSENEAHEKYKEAILKYKK